MLRRLLRRQLAVLSGRIGKLLGDSFRSQFPFAVQRKSGGFHLPWRNCHGIIHVPFFWGNIPNARSIHQSDVTAPE